MTTTATSENVVTDATSNVDNTTTANVIWSDDVKKVIIKRHDYLFKIILLGDTQSGKTNLLSRFIDNSFSDVSPPTIGIDFKTKIVQVKEKSVKLQIWDTAGKQKYESLSELFYRGVMGVIYCFDLTNKNSFKNVEKWIHKLTMSSHFDDRTKCFSAIVGCKSDLTNGREVSSDKGQELAVRTRAQYYECSAKNGDKIEDIFRGLSNSILSHQLGWTHEPLSSQNSGNRNSDKSGVIIRNFSRKAGDRSRSFRRSFRRLSLRSRRKSFNGVERESRRTMSESDMLTLARNGKNVTDARHKNSCTIL